VKICEKYHLSELSVFGSAIRDDFHEGSDVDILISFDDKFYSTICDILDIKDYFSGIFKREIDVVEKEGLRNPLRKEDILSTREIIYAVQ
jgi:predicted nucleotidyltransferase